jgi:hypothetical protein
MITSIAMEYVARWCNTPPEALGEQGGPGNHCLLLNIHRITDLMRPLSKKKKLRNAYAIDSQWYLSIS